MLIKNNSTTRSYIIASTEIPPQGQKTISDEYYDDILSISDLQLIGTPPTDPYHVSQVKTALLVAADGSVRGLLGPNNTTVPLGGGGSYTLPIATTAQLGGLKPDNATLLVNPSTGLASVPLMWRTSLLLPDSTPVIVALGGIATSVYRVTVNPVSGDSVLVETGTSASGPWTAWPDGAVGVTDTGIFAPSTPSVTHMRFTRTAGSGTTSRCYVDEISK